MNAKELLLIFTRNPELGKVKTRLAKDVGNVAALKIYEFLLNHTKNVTEKLEVAKQVWYSENVWKNDIWENATYEKYEQYGNDLGVRMQNAFEDGFQAGYERIIIIGSDLFDISELDIKQAFQKLKSKDAVIGPAEDGGYYLLGLTHMIPQLFQEKSWGTNSVLKATLEDLKSYNFETLETRNDIDYLSDIENLEVFQPYLKAEKKND